MLVLLEILLIVGGYRVVNIQGFSSFYFKEEKWSKMSKNLAYVWLCILVYEKCASIIRDSYDNILENFRKINRADPL